MNNFTFFKCQFLEKEEIWQKADEFYYSNWNQKELPIDIELVAEKIGLDIIPEPGLNENIDALLNIDMSGIIVRASTFTDERYSNRLRFSIAHEIGHLILHKDIIKKMEFTKFADYFDFIQNCSEREYTYFEYQANEFAGRLLVPPAALQKILFQAVEKGTLNLFLDLYNKNKEQLLDGICPFLSKPFGVSEQVIKIRVINEELWNKNCILKLTSELRNWKGEY